VFYWRISDHGNHKLEALGKRLEDTLGRGSVSKDHTSSIGATKRAMRSWLLSVRFQCVRSLRKILSLSESRHIVNVGAAHTKERRKVSCHLFHPHRSLIFLCAFPAEGSGRRPRVLGLEAGVKGVARGAPWTRQRSRREQKPCCPR
jgi:hypothetical protein